MLILTLPLVASGILAGCAPRTIVKTDHCTGWAPIYADGSDVLTDGTARQILAHDEYGARMGCWKAPTRKSEKPDSAKPADAAH